MIQEHWNIVNSSKPREPKKRNYISFSELGQAMADRYCKMMAVKPTNDYEDRVKRIFDAGRVMEFIVLRALTLAGLLKEKQQYVEIPATETTLKLLGYLDGTIGGFVDYDSWKDKIMNHLLEYGLKLDEQLIEQKAIAIIEGFRQAFPLGQVPEMVVEVKSVNSLAFWAHKRMDENNVFTPYPHNVLQTYGYQKARELERGMILYISRDDLMLAECPIYLNDEAVEQQYMQDVLTMTHYYRTETLPPLEPVLVLEEAERRVNLNWKVERSIFLKHLYDYKDKEVLEAAYHQPLLDVNRAIRHADELKTLQDFPGQLTDKETKKLATLQKKYVAEDVAVLQEHAELLKPLKLEVKL